MGAAHRQGEGSISPALQGLERGGAGTGAPLPRQEAMCRLNSTNVLAQVLGQGRTGSPSWQPEAPPTAFPAGAGTWGRPPRSLFSSVWNGSSERLLQGPVSGPARAAQWLSVNL